jgi:GT2 family glycosyltransferase
MISIIIPFRDNVNLLEKCVASILQKTSNSDYEIILVDNNSEKKETFAYLNGIENESKIKILNFCKSFNFSALNNFASRQAAGEFFLFLNNDTVVISENWLDEMLKCLDDEKVGAVGAKLLYPNGTIQHAGVMLEEKRLAIHAFRTWKEENFDFYEPREWSAVTAACMMTRRDLFNSSGGFDEENLPIAYNDVDYCLKLRELGYKIVCTPFAKLHHYESASRKSDVLAKIFNRKRYKQFLSEQEFMRKKWKNELTNDSFYNEKYI